MKLTKAQYLDSLARGFQPRSHNLEGFAEAVFNDNTYDEVKDCRQAAVDQTDMLEWSIDDAEWRDAQQRAIEQALFHYVDENECVE